MHYLLKIKFYWGYLLKIKGYLEIYLADNVKARILSSDGTYNRVAFKDDDERINSQTYFAKRAMKQIKKAKKQEKEQKFIPITAY